MEKTRHVLQGLMNGRGRGCPKRAVTQATASFPGQGSPKPADVTIKSVMQSVNCHVLKCFLSFVPNFELKAEDGSAEAVEARDVVVSL